MAETTIEWAKYTFNPWRGCEKIAPGCDNCYAAAEAKRFPANRGTWGPNGTRVVAAEAQWRKPIQWNRAAECLGTFDCNAGSHSDACPQSSRPRVFCASLADVFEDWEGPMVDVQRRELWVHDCEPNPEPFRYVPMPLEGPGGLMPHERENYGNGMFRRLTMADVRYRLFRLILATPYLDWLVLTKRPHNIQRLSPTWTTVASTESHEIGRSEPRRVDNLWLGTSVATQADAIENVPELLKVAHLAAETFVSAEPLIESVDFRPWLIRDRYYMARCKSCEWVSSSKVFGLDSRESDASLVCPKCDAIEPDAVDARLGVIIAGGESGHSARMFRPNWGRRIKFDTRGTSTKFFLKQMGSNVVERNDMIATADDRTEWPEPYDVEHHINGFLENYQGADCRIRLNDKKGGNMAEWPADLRVREMPEVRR